MPMTEAHRGFSTFSLGRTSPNWEWTDIDAVCQRGIEVQANTSCCSGSICTKVLCAANPFLRSNRVPPGVSPHDVKTFPFPALTASSCVVTLTLSRSKSFQDNVPLKVLLLDVTATASMMQTGGVKPTRPKGSARRRSQTPFPASCRSRYYN